LRVASFFVVLTIALGAAGVGVWNSLHAPTASPSSRVVDDHNEIETRHVTTTPHESTPVTLVRKAVPIEEPEVLEVPVPIDVEVSQLLDLQGPDESIDWTGVCHSTDWTQREEGRVTMTLGRVSSSGLGGDLCKVRLDSQSKSALVSVHLFRDWGPPLEIYWSNVRGHVRVSTWEFTADTRVEVDLSGELEGEERTLHVCRTLGYRNTALR